ncbi:MAG: GxxExxY protein [Candidatus Thiodiazotropha taylori]|nr:GxxExxY protein [Candidatus Thiodiazotropha taylori]MCG7907383.1 GxxExxY protein [Candidatus Thiodiazotropha taylori]MCG7972237.1 GxxExxY protein [Candidatus Thiodiazotropha taylori]MCG8036757.1 GxxExxY protein [Candidatus Thiodiazotropha taylori]
MDANIKRRISEQVIGCVYSVANELGPGFLESVYETALCSELLGLGLEVIRQKQLDVVYKGNVVGKFYADIVVENRLLIEVKAVSRLLPEHKAQVINYLKATGLSVSLLVNFGTPKTEIKRIVWQHDDSIVI